MPLVIFVIYGPEREAARFEDPRFEDPGFQDPGFVIEDS
jgi:hypothetical protein